MKKPFQLLVSLMLFLTASAFAAPGNVWHLPASNESQIATTMRAPVYEAKDNNLIVYQGFFKNGGAGGDQNGGALFYRAIPRGGVAGAWASVSLGFHANVGANQYWKATLPSIPIAASPSLD
jgi:hypothetical protein